MKDRFALTPQHRLLSLAAVHGAASIHADRLREIGVGPINWDDVHQRAYQHRIGCQVYHTLSMVVPELIPAAFRQYWQEMTAKSARHNLTMAGELIRIVDLLGQHGITCLSFKGPVLAAMLHGTVAMRPFADLDLIVATPEDAHAAKQLLVSNGYQAHETLTSRQERILLRTHCEYHLLHPERQIFIDLHWNVFYDYFSYSFDLQQAFRRSITIPVAHHPVRSFCPEDTLLLLSAHHARHAWETLLMVVDIADLLQAHPDLDWPYLCTQADHLGGRRMLHLALLLAERVCLSVVPAFIRSQARSDTAARRLARLVLSRWFDPETGPDTLIAELRFHLRCRERLFHQLRFLLLGLFTPGLHDFATYPLADSWPQWYWAWRPVRLFTRLFARGAREDSSR